MVQLASFLRRVLCMTRLIFPHINGPSVSSYLKREISAGSLASGMQNAPRPTPGTAITVNLSSVLLFLTVTSVYPLFTLNLDSEYLQRNAA